MDDTFTFLLLLLKSYCYSVTELYYRPQTNFAKVMFLQVSVCLSTGGCLPYTRADTPWADTPQPLGQTPPWADTPPLSSACWDTHPPAQCMLGYGLQAGAKHPTGMHSCFARQIVLKLRINEPNLDESDRNYF